MGIQPKPDPDPDDSCPYCFALGKTPSSLKVIFSGLRAGLYAGGDDVNFLNRYYDVPRLPGEQCKWKTADGVEPHIWVALAVPYAMVSMGWTGRGGIFQSWDLPVCTRWFENQRLWEVSYACGGQCYVTNAGIVGGTGGNPAKSLAGMIESVTPMIDPDPRMECFPMPDSEIAVRYAGKRDATNIMIKFDTT